MGVLDGLVGIAMHAQHVEHVHLVVGEAGKGTHPRCSAGAGGVGAAGHQRGERSRPRPTLGRVVGQAERHEGGTEVGVADAQLAELAAVVGDRLGGIVGPADEDLLGGEDDIDRVRVTGDVELAALVEVVQQVDAGQVACRVVEVHVLAARVAAVDPPRGVGRVPLVDRRVELQARVGTVPARLSDAPPQVAGAHRAHR